MRTLTPEQLETYRELRAWYALAAGCETEKEGQEALRTVLRACIGTLEDFIWRKTDEEIVQAHKQVAKAKLLKQEPPTQATNADEQETS